jgi:hypothetical protein
LRWTEESGTGGVGMEIDGSNRHGRKKEESVKVKMKRKVGNLIVFFISDLRLFFSTWCTFIHLKVINGYTLN